AGRAVIVSAETFWERVLGVSGDGRREHALFGQFQLHLGRNRSDDEPVSKIPPPEALVGWRVRAAADRWQGELYARGALEQDRLSAADEADPRIPFGGTPAWWTLNARAHVRPTRTLRLGVALENVFDVRYRIHGSGIDAPGRNLILSVEWIF
ncbi:MAG TPA: TonB-dependent receptor, partial [Candidatus Polarisedimenticolia bacterium]|nr:TonB-dependent receptor [Candidatus Polarisedimenticolia bacterium]